MGSQRENIQFTETGHGESGRQEVQGMCPRWLLGFRLLKKMDLEEGIMGEKTRFAKNSVSSYSGNLVFCHPESIQPSLDSTITSIFLGKQLSSPLVCMIWGIASNIPGTSTNWLKLTRAMDFTVKSDWFWTVSVPLPRNQILDQIVMRETFSVCCT